MATNHLQNIESLFSEHSILDMAAIQKIIPDRSRCSLFRDLQKLEYLSSYNKAGRYYTLKNIPQFDELGIWKYNGVYFSVRGSLKSTAKYLIENTTAGHTHLELQQILDVRVHNTLLDLVSAGDVGREQVRGMYVYTNIIPDAKTKQLEERNKRFEKPPFDPYLAIETLRAVIKHPQRPATAIGSYLSKNGIKITVQQVEEIFALYDLGKKNFQ